MRSPSPRLIPASSSSYMRLLCLVIILAVVGLLWQTEFLSSLQSNGGLAWGAVHHSLIPSSSQLLASYLIHAHELDVLGLIAEDNAVELARPKTESKTFDEVFPPVQTIHDVKTASPVASKEPDVDDNTLPPIDNNVPTEDDVVAAAEMEEEEVQTDIEETSRSSPTQTITATTTTPITPLITWSKLDMKKRGLGSTMYVYKVTSTIGVAVRTMACPIGALLEVYPNEPVGKILRSHHAGEFVVGSKLGHNFGLWLKLGEGQWIPISRKDTPEGDFKRVMVQVKRISIPKRFSYYVTLPNTPCPTTGLSTKKLQSCQDALAIRAAILDFMRRYELLDNNTDPDLATSAADHQTTRADDDDDNVPVIPTIVQDNDDNDPTPLDDDDPIVEIPPLTTTTTSPSTSDNAQIDCTTLRTWARCTRQGHCAWRHLPNREWCEQDEDMYKQPDLSSAPRDVLPISEFDWHQSSSSSERFFVYQPSGGWNNQRLLMENALIICRLLNRTCVAPPAGPHSNYYYNYNKIPATGVVSMSRVLNFYPLIRNVAPVVAVPQGETFSSWFDKSITQAQLSVNVIDKDVTKYKPGTMKKWGEKDIIKLFGGVKEQVLYFANQTMWGTIEWRGSAAGWMEKKLVIANTMPSDHLKRISIKLASALGLFHAVHVRRGDKVGESNFKQVSHAPDWWASRIAEHGDVTKLIYVATDEMKRDYFDGFIKNHGLDLVFWETLPMQNELMAYLEFWPRRMFMDVLGMIEQLLCAYADKFLGSGYSTMTTYILRLRKYRKTLAADTAFDPASELGLPTNARGKKSTCDPITSLTHSKPC